MARRRPAPVGSWAHWRHWAPVPRPPDRGRRTAAGGESAEGSRHPPRIRPSWPHEAERVPEREPGDLRRVPRRSSAPGRRVDRAQSWMMSARVAGTSVRSHGSPGRSIMQVTFEHHPHPRVAAHSKSGPPKTTDEHVGFNGKVALILTTTVGTMWCAYAFGVLALVALPQALGGGLLPIIQWVSQTFIQLVMLSVIMVGQNILSRASDKRADETYQDAEATLHKPQQTRD